MLQESGNFFSWSNLIFNPLQIQNSILDFDWFLFVLKLKVVLGLISWDTHDRSEHTRSKSTLCKLEEAWTC